MLLVYHINFKTNIVIWLNMICADCNINKIYNLKNKICRKCYRFRIKTGKHIVKKTITIPNKINSDQKNLIIGSLLGDGWISPKRKKSYFRINRSIKDLDYLKYEYNILKDFINKEIKTYKTKKNYEIVSFCTLSSDIFSKFRDEWYINGIKRIPKNLKLNKKNIAIWFCDDGCFIKEYKSFYLNLSTNGFPKEDVDLLICKLNSYFKCSYFKAIKHDLKSNNEYGYIIRANSIGSKLFYKKIKKYIPKEMNRKLFNVRTTSKTN